MPARGGPRPPENPSSSGELSPGSRFRGAGPAVLAAGIPVFAGWAAPAAPGHLALAALAGAVCMAVILAAWLLVLHRRMRRLEDSVERRTRERDQLAALVARVNEGQSLPEVLEFLYEEFRAIVPCDRIGYATIDDDGMVRAVWARNRRGEVKLGPGTEVPLPESSLAVLAESGELRTIPDLEAYLRQHPASGPTRLLVEEGLRSSLTVPLRAFGKPVGFLFFNSAEPGAFSQEHARWLRTVAGQVSIILEKSRLMADLERANRDLAEQAETDPLTGLANRRAFERHLEQEWLRCRRSGRSLAVVLVDVDHFKAYNDRYGHARGDGCLLRVGAILRELARRPGDLAARWGGEEFALVLGETSLERAAGIARTLLERVSAEGILHGDSPTAAHLTVSAGVAAGVPVPGTEAGSLVAEADAALYRAKAAGRNRVEVSR